ncbi:MAG: efflux transporter outer membrane subunit [Vicinamibacterales bacterium]
MRRLAAVLMACPIAGCMMGPNYQRPVVEVPPVHRYEMAEARDTANTAWWEQFGDPVLDSLIDEALANNLSVKIAAANVEQAAAVLTQARSPLYPQGGYGANASGQRRNEKIGAVYSDDALAGASWEIDLWGRIRRLSEAARAQMLATEEARLGVVLSLVASVANSYLQLRALDEQLVIATRTKEAYAESVRLFELQFKYGVQSRMTVEQARTQYETAAAAIPQIELEIAQTENALSVLLGRNPGPIQRGQAIGALTMPAIPAGIPSQVLERRPDLRQAEQQLVAANAQIGAAKALYFPTISLTGALGLVSIDLANLFKGPTGTWSYQGSIAGPIFTGGAISGQVRQTEAARKAAEFGYAAAIQRAFADIDNALVARAKLVDQLAAERRLVAASREYGRLAKLQFDGGVAPYFTVLQAEQQLFPAELNEVQLRASLFAATVNVYKAMGGGWVSEADQRTR